MRPRKILKFTLIGLGAAILGALAATAVLANAVPQVGKALADSWEHVVSSVDGGNRVKPPDLMFPPPKLPTPVPSSIVAAPTGSAAEQFREYRIKQEERLNTLIDVINVLVDEQKQTRDEIETLKANQKTFFSLHEDLRLRLEMLSGGYKRIEAEDTLPISQNDL